ncbi:hypothetical protein CL619_00630, partial [archaeon]|nr:hypothetical protein [archaeon]
MNVPALIRKEALRKGLRNETIKTYITCVNKFFRVYRLDPRAITRKDVENYLDQLRNWNKSSSTINVNLQALKFFYEKVLKKKLTVNFETTKVRKRIPEFLTKEETSQLFDSIHNEKHQLMIKLLYATGMRVSELTSLQVKHFEFDQNYGWVRNGKGGKDRLFIVAVKLKKEIVQWIEKNSLQNDDWLFPGSARNHISASTIRKILKDSARKVGITKNVHPHTMRHSFATHLIQNGYAVTDVQPLLGHNSMQTTMIYLHMG